MNNESRRREATLLENMVSMYKEIMVKYDGGSLANVSLYILSRKSLTIGWQRSSFREEEIKSAERLVERLV